MKELNLQEIQHAELKNLKFLDKLCKQNGFTYYLAYGTLLGAVRHKGFIPWDDDTDIWMPRKDYSDFLAYCKEHEDELKPFKLSTRENTKNYPYGIARFCNQEYKYVTTNSSENAFELGVFTDIYPLDNFGNDDSEGLQKMKKKCNKINVSYSRYCSGVSNNKIKAILKKINYLYLHLIHGKNYAKVVDKEIIDAITKNTSSSDKYIGLIAWDSLNGFRYKKSNFKKSIRVDFEDYKFPIPQGYDQILKITYGDYMKFPPKSERHPYHGYKIYKK